jgi:hypothetical protein
VSWVWYFAYGSNMQTATFRGRRGIEPRRALGVRARGWRLVLDKPPLVSIGHSFANLVPDVDAIAYGVVYEISVEDLAHVEYSEGVPLGNYCRAELEVEALATPRETLRAVTLTSDKRGEGLTPSLRYMGLLIEGALEHALPDEWVAMLRALPAIEESEEAKNLRAFLDQVMKKEKPR